MEIIKYEDYNDNLIYIIDKIYFQDYTNLLLCKQCDDEINIRILNNLKLLGSSVDSIDMFNMTYSAYGNNFIPLDYLSSSEKVFVICELYNTFKKKLYIKDHIRSLDSSNIELLIKLYSNSEYINICSNADSESFYNMLKYIYEEVNYAV